MYKSTFHSQETSFPLLEPLNRVHPQEQAKCPQNRGVPLCPSTYALVASSRWPIGIYLSSSCNQFSKYFSQEVFLKAIKWRQICGHILTQYQYRITVIAMTCLQDWNYWLLFLTGWQHHQILWISARSSTLPLDSKLQCQLSPARSVLHAKTWLQCPRQWSSKVF